MTYIGSGDVFSSLSTLRRVPLRFFTIFFTTRYSVVAVTTNTNNATTAVITAMSELELGESKVVLKVDPVSVVPGVVLS